MAETSELTIYLIGPEGSRNSQYYAVTQGVAPDGAIPVVEEMQVTPQQLDRIDLIIKKSAGRTIAVVRALIFTALAEPKTPASA